MPYADNGNIIARSREEADFMLEGLGKIIHSDGLATHEKEGATRELSLVGLVLHGGRHRLLSHAPRRAWRLWCALGALLRRRHCTGEQMQVVLGHCAYFGMLERNAISMFSATVRALNFVSHQCNDGRPSCFWGVVLCCHHR